MGIGLFTGGTIWLWTHGHVNVSVWVPRQFSCRLALALPSGEEPAADSEMKARPFAIPLRALQDGGGEMNWLVLGSTLQHVSWT